MVVDREANCAVQDVEWAFRVARMLINDLRNLRREFRSFRDGWTGDDADDSESPGNPEQLRALLIELQQRENEHEQSHARIHFALQSANANWLTPYIYSSPLSESDHERPVTAFVAVDELAFIASDACTRLVFNVDGDGGPRTDMPAPKSKQFARECAECEKAMAAVTAEELARVEALLTIEELRTKEWLTRQQVPLSSTHHGDEQQEQNTIEEGDTVPRESSRQQKLKTRNQQIKLLCKTHNCNGKWAELATRANTDPAITQLGLKPITKHIARNVIVPPQRRLKK